MESEGYYVFGVNVLINGIFFFMIKKWKYNLSLSLIINSILFYFLMVHYGNQGKLIIIEVNYLLATIFILIVTNLILNLREEKK